MKKIDEILTMLNTDKIKVRLVHGMFFECGGVVGNSPEKPEIFYVWLNAEYVEDEILSSFKHELWHIACNDFESRDSANRIEAIAHKAEKHNFYGFFDGVDLKPYLENAKVITYEGREKSA